MLYFAVLVFLLQSVAPAFQGAMARSTAGYTDIVCTMYGPQKVFVPLEGEPGQDPPACHECPLCILQAGTDDEPLPSSTAIGTQNHSDTGIPAAPPCPASDPLHYSPFLSRAPPA